MAPRIALTCPSPGGNTFYFGPVGENGKDVIKYFGDRGVQCPPSKNVAEFILETAAKPVKRKDGSRINWNEEWLKSENSKEVLNEIERVKSERSQKAPAKQDAEEESEFAAPVWLQITMLTKRTFVQQWRDPSYVYGKLFTAVIIGIFNGFTFYQLGNSIGDMQNRMFTSFLIILIPPTIVNAVVPKFYQNMALWQARELPSRIYGWVAFVSFPYSCSNLYCTIAVRNDHQASASAISHWENELSSLRTNSNITLGHRPSRC